MTIKRIIAAADVSARTRSSTTRRSVHGLMYHDFSCTQGGYALLETQLQLLQDHYASEAAQITDTPR